MVCLLLGVGMYLSIKDYRSWRYEETKNYGHGPGELYSPAEQLSEKYEAKVIGFRLRYPWGWKLDVDSEFQKLLASEEARTQPKKWEQIFKEGSMTDALTLQKTGVEQIVPTISLKLGTTRTVSTDYVTTELARYKQMPGVRLVGDRDYVNTDRVQWTIITTQLNSKETKHAYMMVGERLFVATMDYAIGKHYVYLRTFEDFLRNVVVY